MPSRQQVRMPCHGAGPWIELALGLKLDRLDANGASGLEAAHALRGVRAPSAGVTSGVRPGGRAPRHGPVDSDQPPVEGPRTSAAVRPSGLDPGIRAPASEPEHDFLQAGRTRTRQFDEIPAVLRPVVPPDVNNRTEPPSEALAPGENSSTIACPAAECARRCSRASLDLELWLPAVGSNVGKGIAPRVSSEGFRRSIGIRQK
jgi:hypothetical protein